MHGTKDTWLCKGQCNLEYTPRIFILKCYTLYIYLTERPITSTNAMTPATVYRLFSTVYLLLATAD